jgi:hypothetical protein
MRHGATDDDLPIVGFDLHALAIAKPGSPNDLAREPDGQVLSLPPNSDLCHVLSRSS